MSMILFETLSIQRSELEIMVTYKTEKASAKKYEDDNRNSPLTAMPEDRLYPC